MTFSKPRNRSGVSWMERIQPDERHVVAMDRIKTQHVSISVWVMQQPNLTRIGDISAMFLAKISTVASDLEPRARYVLNIATFSSFLRTVAFEITSHKLRQLIHNNFLERSHRGSCVAFPCMPSWTALLAKRLQWIFWPKNVLLMSLFCATLDSQTLKWAIWTCFSICCIFLSYMAPWSPWLLLASAGWNSSPPWHSRATPQIKKMLQMSQNN